MSKRVLILVEGQTEERFVKDVLAPAFWARDLYFFPTILVTKRVKDGPNFSGGITRFVRFENDLRRLLHSTGDVLVTTMLDFYRLPPDFPGMSTKPSNGSSLQRVTHVEEAIATRLQNPENFVPFLALHEFEAWLFTSPTELPLVMTDPVKAKSFAAIRDAVQTPEEINERPEYAPSRQILRLFPAYRKTVHGPTTLARIGLRRIRAECPHFHNWVNQIDAFAGT